MTNEEWTNFLQIKTFDDTERYSARYKNKELTFASVGEEISFLYNLGLFFSETFQTTDKIEVVFCKEDKYYLPIYYYLKAIRLYEKNRDVIDRDRSFVFEIIRRLYVNIGNEFNNQFRTISALAYFRKALEIDDCFDMAIGNYAIGIEHHNPLVGVPKDTYSKVYNFLFELYTDLRVENIENGSELFTSRQACYRETHVETLGNGRDGKRIEYIPYTFFTEINNSDSSYENWCVQNTLYLNYLNDIGSFEEAKFDIDLHSLNSELGLTKGRLYVLGNLFDLYIFLRRKIYDCRSLASKDTLLELGRVFQSLYSYFDKTAFFIYRYFKLVGKEGDVDIISVWDMEDENGKSIMEYKNQYLYDIYWLRKEYRGKERKPGSFRINELQSPNAQDYANIRNVLEHKEYSFEKIKGITYLKPTLLYDKTVRMAGIVRNMILSVVQMILTEKKLCDPKTGKRNLDLIYLTYGGFGQG